MLDKSAFSEAIDYVLQDEGRVTIALVPRVFQLGAGDQPLEPRYRPRDRIEAVRRVWGIAEVHAMALVAMIREDYDSARSWAEYVDVEIDADKLILAETGPFGVDEARVRATPPYRSTAALAATLMRNVSTLGSLPAAAYAVAVEWHWARATLVGKERGGREAWGLEFIRAIAAHPEANQHKDHSTRVVEIAHRLALRQPNGMQMFFALLRQNAAAFRSYFGELYLFGAAEVPEQQREVGRAQKGA